MKTSTPVLTRLVGSLLFCTALVLPRPASAAVDRLCDTRLEDCRAPLLAYINAEPAGGGIDVAFWFMTDDLYRVALRNAYNRGVRVRVLMDPRANDSKTGNAYELNAFKTDGLPMRMKVAKSWSDILHWKMMYFEKQGIVEWSAANYTEDSFKPAVPTQDYIDEVVWFTDDRRLVQTMRWQFENYWTDTSGNFTDYANMNVPQPFDVRARFYSTDPSLVIPDPALNFPPAQQYIPKAVTHSKNEYGLTGAKIDVIMYRISNNLLPDAMIDAFTKQNIPVRLITEQENYRDSRYIWHSYNVDRMWAADIPVKDHVKGKAGITHQKSFILYGQKEVIYGSSNWSTASSNQQVEHNIFSLPCKANQTTWCDTNNWFFNWFVNQFNQKWNNVNPTNFIEFKPFIPLPGGTPVNSAPASGATGVSITPTLKWDGGNWNHKYDVYLGTDPNNLPKVATDLSCLTSSPCSPGFAGSPETGKYETWQIPPELALQPGRTYYWKIVGKTMASGQKDAGVKFDKPGLVWSFTTAGTSAGGGPTPYQNNPAVLPGSIQAENFDDGGPGVAYSDTTAGNQGNVYRTTDVDIGPISGGGYYVGWTRVNEYLLYTANIQTTGTYRLDVNVANKGTGARFHVEVDGQNVTGSLPVPDTTAYDNYKTVSKSGISLTAKNGVPVRLVMEAVSTAGGAGNFDSLAFTLDNSAPPQVATPHNGNATPWLANGTTTIQAEDFDDGPSGVAYLDTTSGNNGNVYRVGTNVDIAALSTGGYYIGWTRATEWMQYTINVPAAGTYRLDVRVANKGTGATLHAELNGQNLTGGPVAVPDTKAYETFTTVSTNIQLPAGGALPFRLKFDAVSSSGGAGNVDWLKLTPVP